MKLTVLIRDSTKSIRLPLILASGLPDTNLYLYTPFNGALKVTHAASPLTGSVTVKKYLPNKKMGTDVNITQSNVTLEAGEIVLVKLNALT